MGLIVTFFNDIFHLALSLKVPRFKLEFEHYITGWFKAGLTLLLADLYIIWKLPWKLLNW